MSILTSSQVQVNMVISGEINFFLEMSQLKQNLLKTFRRIFPKIFS